jgi:hypothetical protein
MIWRLCFYKRIGALPTHAYVHKRMLPRVICLVQALVWMGQRQLREIFWLDQAGQEGNQGGVMVIAQPPNPFPMLDHCR